MSGAVLVAIAAAIGNLLQGWDNATIAGNFSISSASNYFIWFTETSICLQKHTGKACLSLPQK